MDPFSFKKTLDLLHEANLNMTKKITDKKEKESRKRLVRLCTIISDEYGEDFEE